MTDLSMLTPAEIMQFDGDNGSVLTDGVPVALYMRYSSERQSEQSIEGQLRDAIAYCKRQEYCISRIYVDRATSAHSRIDKRVHFLEMIADSEQRLWQSVIVWKLDRFSRNRYESAIYKNKLKKNGVKVLSVTENISDSPEGVILEAVLEGMAEFYSKELSQKITRGMRETALKCRSTGGQIPLGYKIEDHRLVIDPLTAPIVQKAFEMYAQGRTISQIMTDFNNRGYRTALGRPFGKSSFNALLRNRRYTGVYRYTDIEIEGGMPAIISENLFERVQQKLHRNAAAPGRGKAKVNYLLSGKLFCGHCGGAMIGESGHNHNDVVYNYYICSRRKKQRKCSKKAIRKELIENYVAEDALALLTGDLIEEIADVAVEQNRREILETSRLPQLQSQRDEVTKQIDNLTAAIALGAVSRTITQRVSDLERQRDEIDRQMMIETKSHFVLEREHVIFWLSKFKDGDINDEKFRQNLFDLLINSVTVWDEPDKTIKITVVYNLTDKPTQTFRVGKDFSFDDPCATIARYVRTTHVWGKAVAQTIRHPL